MEILHFWEEQKRYNGCSRISQVGQGDLWKLGLTLHPRPPAKPECLGSVTELIRQNFLHTRRKKPHSTVFEGRKPFLLLLNGAWEVRPTRLSLLWEVDSVGVTSHLKRVNRLSVERCWRGYRFHSRPKSRMNHSHGPVATSSLLLLSPSNLLKNKITL